VDADEIEVANAHSRLAWLGLGFSTLEITNKCKVTAHGR